MKTISAGMGWHMRVREIALERQADESRLAGVVDWEDAAHPSTRIEFGVAGRHDFPSDRHWGDAFLAACLPLATFMGERRLRIETPACPMLVDGLHSVHAWWTRWRRDTPPMPVIEVPAPPRTASRQAAPEATGCLSGGVDGLHMLLHNRRLFGRSDPAFIRRALFVHGFDIGRRRRDPQEARFRMAAGRLRKLAEATDLELVTCRTNLRHLPIPPGLWLHRYFGAA
ncbi:MAG TPA: hypothetical protein VHN20_00465, partial [Beijerinckiaceae bacterium]|nr:hypothetical protein [Beijerinckiaceae bacterium]